MPQPSTFTALAVEPNAALTIPYMYLPDRYTLTCVGSLRRAKTVIKECGPDLVLLSTSFPAAETVRFLESLKNLSSTRIIPLFFVIDLTHPVSEVLGTSWGDRLAVTSSIATKEEFLCALERITS